LPIPKSTRRFGRQDGWTPRASLRSRAVCCDTVRDAHAALIRLARSALFDILLLLLATAVLILPLFRIEFFNDWMSIEGSFIADARFIRDHWPHPAWHALWYCGTRFDYVYPPGTRYGAAIAAMLFHATPARGYHIYIGALYCLGVAGIYLLVLTGTGSRGAAWLAAAAEALLSPEFLLLKAYRVDSLRWMPERLNVLIKWGEGPHICALAAIPFALAFSLLAFRKGRAWTVGAAALCCAFVVTNNLYGALALGIFFPVLLWSAYAAMPGSFPWRRAGAIVLLAAGLCAWWLTPSFVRLTERNLALVAQPGNRWSQFAGLVLVMLFAAASQWAGRVRGASMWSLFVAGSLLFFTVEVLGQFWFGFRITGEPMRFVPEFDIVLILGAVEGVRRLWRFRRWAAIAVTALGFSFSARYLAKPWSVYLPDPDYRRRVEYRMPEWIAGNLPGSRIFSFGSVSFWYTAWRDLPEVTGGSDQGMQTLMPALARYQIRVADEAQRDVYWLQSLGADAIIVHEANSEEIYHDVKSPRKFMGLLPVIYERDGDIVYRVPRRSGLARVVDEQRISHLQPIPWSNEDTAQLRAYAETLEAIGSTAAYSRPGIDQITISAVTQAGQSVLVQENFDPGWHAVVDGKAAPIAKDIMEFMRVQTAPGAHEIRFIYRPPPESRIGMWISAISLAAAAVLAATARRP
jgi:hypothetical protein